MTRAPHRIVALVAGGVLALASSSCAREGILRLDVELREGPGAFGEREYLVVEVAGDAAASEASWRAQSFATQGAQFTQLVAGGRPTVPFDVMSSRTDVRVSVRARYCRLPGCVDPADIAGIASDEPGFRFTIARAVWIGHVSRVRIAVPPIEDEGARFAGVPEPADEAMPYPATGWICRCQVRCDGDGEDTNEFGSCDGTRAPCDATAEHRCGP